MTWTRLPIKRLGDVFLGKMIQPEPKLESDIAAPYLRAAHVQPYGQIIDVDDKTMWFSEGELRLHDLRADDVVIVEGGAGYGRSAVVRTDRKGWGFQNSIVRIRPRPLRATGRFLDYALQAALAAGEIEIACFTATIPHFTADKVGAFPVPAPPVEEQRAIADYLDRETDRIDTLIEEQKRLIEMLRERRSALIDVTVWSGLDPRAPQGPTGIDPVSMAPAHWRRVRNKNLFFESSAVSVDGDEELLTVSHLTGITPRSEKRNVTMIEAESLEGYRLVEPGDLVINTMWAWMGALGVSKISGIVSPAYGVYRPLVQVEVEPRYFDYLYRSRPYVTEMTRHSRGIWESRLRLYPESFLRLPVVLPPVDEQRRIADFLDEQTLKIDALIFEAETFVQLAGERRSALIMAAVTGQIDVREAA
ncbi:restriction endonuclease subunit S [Streptomyces yunnanensis]|uniref:Restriction endonuclease S subunit n=1 Tax=Streptomyces yunnanensis TaxID=156453 RepID=A0A9X8QQD6_9ACTN|nr:restriction endonuclease subunit S [Streptomyces yunnanensis]SHL26343.1 Restriction endonuclease S subunit [Streptomyces yunnanensis]